jgi:hypothetical protein
MAASGFRCPPAVVLRLSALPGDGKIAATYVGQLVFSSSAGSVTIPVSVSVGDSVFRQENALSFNKVYADTQNPLPQTFLVTSTGAAFNFGVSTYTASGGDWLKASASGCCYGTSTAITVTAAPASSLAAGVYAGQILVYSQDGSMAMTVPVSLTIGATSSPLIADIQGQASFFLLPNATANPAPQAVWIRNAGSGTLNWSASATTSDGGKWVTLSASSGTAPASLSVGVSLSSLPGAGKVAGTYTGQVRIASSTEVTTVPVTVVIGTNVFKPLPAVEFSKPTSSSSVPGQSITVSSLGASINFGVSHFSGRGGNWLAVGQNGCCYGMPTTLTLSVNPSVSLSDGVYAAEVVLTQQDGSTAMTIPVYYTVGPAPTWTTLHSSVNPATAGQAVTFTADVAGFGSGVSGSVTFKDGTTTLATVSLSGGVATYTTSTLPIGTDSITAVYSGSSAFESSTSAAVAEVVNSTHPATKTVLASALNPAIAGTALKLTATVTSSAANITGSVTFKSGSTTLATVNLANGTATYTIPKLAAGSQSLTATYNGDSAHSSSVSAAIIQLTLWPTATKIVSSTNPATVGQYVTFTATITASATGVSGYVTFFDGSTPISTVAASNGVAVLTSAELAKGSHTISAIYGGSYLFVGSSSPALVETVN